MHTTEPEILHGGREGKIARSQDKVLRPANPWTPYIHAFLSFMGKEGFTGIPQPFGIENGMETVSYVEGTVYNDSLPDAILTDTVLADVATLLRRYHDLAQAYIPRLTGEEEWMLPARTPAEVMCHGDFAPYNMTFLEGRVHGIIDFDTLHPGPKLWDIAYAVYRWVPFVSPDNPDYRHELPQQIRRLKLFADTYGLTWEQRGELPEMMLRRIGSLVTYMETEAAAGNEDVLRNIADGHLKLYLSDIAYIEAHREQILSGIR